VNFPYSSTVKPAAAHQRTAEDSLSSAGNAPGRVLREMAAAMGAALGVAAGINLLLLWLGIGPV